MMIAGTDRESLRAELSEAGLSPAVAA
jgi:hypothetical protein